MSLFAITLSCGHVVPMMAYHGQPLCNCKRYRLSERLRRMREARERAGATCP